MPAHQKNMIIFSRPVRSGKTSVLQNFIKENRSVAGILTPDLGGKRMLYDIANEHYHPFETNIEDGPNSLSVGKFYFLKDAFEKGREILRSIGDSNFMIIDEVGKLEIEQDLGFEPAVSQLINHCKFNISTKLILVIRDSLVEKAILKYGLQNTVITDQL